ncbi:MAG: T9SS type A sorting domain-containing protein, partial [Flavobacteriales bacterium]|nr:T9SS type A sorting domain-containing protein [Flavobacteriales bacterium]
SVNICSGSTYTFHDGTIHTNITVNEGYASSLTTAQGCDSTITTNVNVVSVINVSESVATCSGQTVTYPDGFSEVITANTSHASTLTSSGGCDSIITTNVTVLQTYDLNQSVNVCTGADYTYPDGTVHTSIVINENCTSSLTTVSGCDSVVTTNLTVLSSLASTDNVTVCSGETYTYPDGTVSNNIIVNESHVSPFTSAFGCDSTITTNVVVNALPIITTTTSTTEILSDQSGAAYQWFDCSTGFIAIVGENGQSFTPTTSGFYAVQVDLNSCVDTSACQLFSIVGVAEFEGDDFSIYPNPVVDLLIVESNNTEPNASYTIYDIGGKVVLKGGLSERTVIDTERLMSGVYFIEIGIGRRARFIKQ